VRRILLILIVLLAVRLVPKVLRKEALVLELLVLLVQVSALSAKNTSKTVSTEGRTTALEARTSATAARVAKVIGGNTGFANALGYGATSTANIGTTSAPDAGDTGNYSFSTGPQIGGAAAHVHNGTLSNLPNVNHTHAFGGHTHDFGGHKHPSTGG
jgi:hypothetical protein